MEGGGPKANRRERETERVSVNDGARERERGTHVEQTERKPGREERQRQRE